MKIKDWELEMRRMSNNNRLKLYNALTIVIRVKIFKEAYPELLTLRVLLGHIINF